MQYHYYYDACKSSLYKGISLEKAKEAVEEFEKDGNSVMVVIDDDIRLENISDIGKYLKRGIYKEEIESFKGEYNIDSFYDFTNTIVYKALGYSCDEIEEKLRKPKC